MAGLNFAEIGRNLNGGSKIPPYRARDRSVGTPGLFRRWLEP